MPCKDYNAAQKAATGVCPHRGLFFDCTGKKYDSPYVILDPDPSVPRKPNNGYLAGRSPCSKCVG